jgi:hypothetical protein
MRSSVDACRHSQTPNASVYTRIMFFERTLMSVPTSVHRVGPTVICLLLLGTLSVAATAQVDRFVGRWMAHETDHGIVVSLTIGSSSTLTMPGIRQDGTSTALTLVVRNLMTQGDSAAFTVDLPENEGTLDLELRVADTDAGVLRVIRVDGEVADDDVPTWMVRKVR